MVAALAATVAMKERLGEHSPEEITRAGVPQNAGGVPSRSRERKRECACFADGDARLNDTEQTPARGSKGCEVYVLQNLPIGVKINF